MARNLRGKGKEFTNFLNRRFWHRSLYSNDDIHVIFQYSDSNSAKSSILVIDEYLNEETLFDNLLFINLGLQRKIQYSYSSFIFPFSVALAVCNLIFLSLRETYCSNELSADLVTLPVLSSTII